MKVNKLWKQAMKKTEAFMEHMFLWQKAAFIKHMSEEGINEL